MTDMPPYAYTSVELEDITGHWTPAEIEATGASRECIASFLGYLERTMEISPSEADKEEVTEHIQERLREDPGYDQWRKGGT